MPGIVNYIRHDLEGVYTAELLRGSISMLAATVLLLCTEQTPASAYMLIMALYGLRSLTPVHFFKRMAWLCLSLGLLTIILIIAMQLGQQRLYVPAILLAAILSTWTVYLLSFNSHFSGTVMFMSVFSIVNFGMGLTDAAQNITSEELIKASGIGSGCVLLAALTVPVINFHWCLLINHCFHHDLQALCNCILEAPDYGSQYDLPLHTRDKLLELESSLLNITGFVRSPKRQQLYQNLTGGIILIIFWPAAHTGPQHLQTVNKLRREALSAIIHIVCHRTTNASLSLNDSNSAESVSANDPFCNGELTRHIAKVIADANELNNWERSNPARGADNEDRT